GPSLKNDDRPRQACPPASEHTSERPAHLLPAVGCFPVHACDSKVVSSCCGTFRAGGSSGRSVMNTPRCRETGRPRAAQFALRTVYIPGGGTTWCGRKERAMVTADLLYRARAGDGQAFGELAE